MFTQTEDVGSLLAACGTNAWVPASKAEIEIPASSSEALVRGTEKTSSRFPALEEVTLDRVEACSVAPFRTFFNALPALKRLTLHHTSMHAMQGLMPLDEERHSQGLASPTSSAPCPCPKLRSVHIRGAALDFDLIANTRSARIQHGAYAFDPEITLDHCRADDMVHVGAPGFEGTEVRIRSSDPYQAGGIDFEDAAMDLEMGNVTKEDPFALGGAFNDPAFDAYYGQQMGIMTQF
jgi:hypothetical protein